MILLHPTPFCLVITVVNEKAKQFRSTLKERESKRLDLFGQKAYSSARLQFHRPKCFLPNHRSEIKDRILIDIFMAWDNLMIDLCHSTQPQVSETLCKKGDTSRVYRIYVPDTMVKRPELYLPLTPLVPRAFCKLRPRSNSSS